LGKFLSGLVVGIIVGAFGLWFYATGGDSTPVIRDAQRQAGEQTRKAVESVQNAAEEARGALGARLEALELGPDDIKRDLAQSGRVVRQRARELRDTVADATADARITAAVKARLAADPELSALEISVDTTARRVTLAGTVATPDLVGKAVALALATDGVQAVDSTLQVK
jgi:osmotically-inducible protein OsmY